MMKVKRIHFVLIMTLFVFLILSWQGCGEVDKNEIKQGKISFNLNALVMAESENRTEELVSGRGDYTFTEDGVRVTIQTFPGRVNEAAEIVAMYGKVEIILEKLDRIQAVVPIEKLVELSQEGSIKMIDTPHKTTTG